MPGPRLLASQPSTLALRNHEGREGDEVAVLEERRGCRGRSLLASSPSTFAHENMNSVKTMK